MSDRLLTDREVSQITSRARSTLQKDRLVGGGIPYVYVGRLVRYRASDVEAYIAALPTCRSTSEATAAE
jgi:predicted DNA-binding transcriptional regulator AlpA